MCVSPAVGPSPLLPLPASTPSLALLLVAVGVNGAAVGLTVPSARSRAEALARSGFSKEEVSEPIGSIGRSITAVGQMLGPVSARPRREPGCVGVLLSGLALVALIGTALLPRRQCDGADAVQL